MRFYLLSGQWRGLVLPAESTHTIVLVWLTPLKQPEWMKLSTVAPLNAGGVIIRDLRAWVSSLSHSSFSCALFHCEVTGYCVVLVRCVVLCSEQHGGTPNLSDEVRAIPNAEFHAPW